DSTTVDTGGSVLSYAPNYATGTIQLYGDYTVSNSTLTLDYAANLWASTATVPISSRGGAVVSTVPFTSDGNAVSQLVTIVYDGTNWNITGSVTGSMGQFTAGYGNTQDLPTGTTQFTLKLTKVGIPNPDPGDRSDFILIGASRDSNIQKKL